MITHHGRNIYPAYLLLSLCLLCQVEKGTLWAQQTAMGHSDPPQQSFLNSNPDIAQVHTNINTGNRPVEVFIDLTPETIEIGTKGNPIPETIRIKGKRVRLRYPKLIRGTPAQMKDLAISDIRCLDIDQGLNAGLITSIIEDRHGYLWIGSEGGGVSRYDGSNFAHFTTAEGLTHNTVNAILEDRTGMIWIATGGGLSRFDGEDFVHFTTEEGLSHNYIHSMVMDQRGHIWLGTTGGLSRIEPNYNDQPQAFDGMITNYSPREGLADASVRTLAIDGLGNVWLGTHNNGVQCFVPNDSDKGGLLRHLSTRNGLSGDRVRALLADSQGRIWIGTFDNGLNIYESRGGGANGRLLQFSSDNGLSNRSVSSFREDRHRNIWIGTGGGINRFDPQADGTAQFTFYSTEHGLCHTRVYVIFEDSQGNIWLGTANGMCVYDPVQNDTGGGSSFRHYSKRNGLLSDKVVSILEDRRGDMWFGTMGGLHRYDGQTIARFNIEDGLSSRSVRAMMEDQRGHLWFGTERGGLNRYIPGPDGTTGEILQYGVAQGLTDIHVTAMLEDSRGNCWFGTLRDGVNRFRPDEPGNGGTFTPYRMAEGLSSNNIRFILEDKQGNIWFGTHGGGASCYTPNPKGSAGTFKHFTTEDGLSHNSVNTILQDSRGQLWFGTWGGGVTRYDPITGRISYYTTEDGLTSNIIWTIVEDQENRIWMATERGISLLVPKPAASPAVEANTKEKFRMYTFSKPDGLKKIVFEGNSVCLTRTNQLWWGGGYNEGLSMLDLNQFKLPRQVPRVAFSNLEIRQRFIDYRNLQSVQREAVPFVGALVSSVDSVAPFTNLPIGLKLPYKLNHLTFQFSAIDWQAPHKIQYSYRLQGLEEEWSPPGPGHSADYRNIPYGDFVFQVRAIGAAQIWSEPISYAFSIAPPWWHRWWARLIYLALVLAAIYQFLQWRLQKLQKEKEDKQAFAEALIDAQEVEKKRIARDLHDGIGQSLLLLKKQMERNTAATRENQRLVETTLQEVRSISRDLHPFQLEKFGLTVAIQESIRKVQQSTDLFITKDIENIDKKLPARAEINLFRVIQEAMSNIIKHAEASAAKISISTNDYEIRVLIQDNGKGFDPDFKLKTAKSLGLKTMEERVASIGGQLSIKGGKPKGTSLNIAVPICHS